MSEPQPLVAEVEQMWRELEVVPEGQPPPAVQQLVHAFRKVYDSGGAEFASFRYAPHRVLDWFARHGSLTLPHLDFASRFVTLPPVRGSLPDLRIPARLTRDIEGYLLDEFDLEAELGRALSLGGAYGRFHGTRREAMQCAASFVDAMSDALEPRQWVFHSSTPWTPWFQDIAWDHTWLGVDPVQRRVWLLGTTDAD